MQKRKRDDDEQENTGNDQDVEENRMHPRNPYARAPPDFTKLAKEFETFRPFVQKDKQGRPFIDFKDPDAVREFTRCLLKRDFDLDVYLPPDRLCPPVPNRLNYILWIQDILEETLTPEERKDVHGIDIGVGASCIYPLLGCALDPDWSFLGTDIDETSVKYARENVDRNGFLDRISIKYNETPERIFSLEKGQSYAFCMCNPPFYASREEMEQGRENKELEPSAVCTGSETEMITDGGEYGFIERIINESLIYKDRIRWYTSLIGLKKTVWPLVNRLRELNIHNYVVTEFCQGRTKRWGIAWSFGSARVNKASSLEEYRPKSQFTATLPKPVDDVQNELHTILHDLNIQFETQERAIFGSPKANTWSRAARRQLKKRQKIEEQEHPLFTFHIEIKGTQSGSQLVTTWVRGKDRDIFESFWNHVKKRIEQACGIERGAAFKK